MEIAIIKRETTGSGPNSYSDNETVAKYEIMDGAPVRGNFRKYYCIVISSSLTGFPLFLKSSKKLIIFQFYFLGPLKFFFHPKLLKTSYFSMC